MLKKENYKTQLDALQRKQTVKTIFRVICFCFLLIGVYFLYFLYMSANHSGIVSGKALSLADSTSGKKLEVHILVELKDGNIIQALFPSSNQFNKGDIVFLNEYSTKIFGGKRYSFIKIEKSIESREP